MANVARRPGIPIILPCAIACWMAAAASYVAFAGTDSDVPNAIAIASLALGTVALLAAIVGFHAKAALIVIFLAIGCMLGSSAIGSYDKAILDVPSDADWEFTLTTDPKESRFGYVAEADGVSANNAKAHVRLYLDDRDGLFSRATIHAHASLRPIAREDVERCYKSGIVATASIDRYEMVPLYPIEQAIYDMRANSIAAFASHAGDQAGILQALICGYRRTIEESGEYDDFKRCGLAHVVAVSGAHLAIVTMVFGLFLRTIHASRRATVLMSTFFALAYLLFAGVPISAVRAAIMVILAMSSGLLKRRSSSLGSLAICVIAFIAADPRSAVSVSLLLSAGSTLGIIVFAKLIASWFDDLPKPMQKGVGDPLALTMSSNIVTMPYCVATFGQLPTISPLSNIIATPLFSAACVIGLVAALASCLSEQVGAILIALAAVAATPLSMSVDMLSSLSFASIQVDAPMLPMAILTVVLCSLLWWLWPKVSMRLIGSTVAVFALMVALAFVRLPSSMVHRDEIIMLDVGQGDAFVVTSNGATILVDTGNQDAMLTSELARFGISKLDAVLITHPDDDHCGSLSALASCADVRRIAFAEDMLACPCSKCKGLTSISHGIVGEGNVMGLAVGTTISVGSFELEVIWPHAYADEGSNSDSLCLLATIDCNGDGNVDWTTLLTGDAESEQLERMVSNGDVSDIDVLKVGHHGSKASLSERALQALDPEIALISVGESNRYGHPSDQALNLLSGSGSDVLRTDKMGSVRLAFSVSGIAIE